MPKSTQSHSRDRHTDDAATASAASSAQETIRLGSFSSFEGFYPSPIDLELDTATLVAQWVPALLQCLDIMVDDGQTSGFIMYRKDLSQHTKKPQMLIEQLRQLQCVSSAALSRRPQKIIQHILGVRHLSSAERRSIPQTTGHTIASVSPARPSRCGCSAVHHAHSITKIRRGAQDFVNCYLTWRRTFFASQVSSRLDESKR